MRKGIVACLWLVLAGCGSEGDGSGGGFGVPGSASNRSFTRDDGAVTTLPNLSGGFTAMQTVTLSNDDAGAAQGVVTLLNENGGVNSATSVSGYQVQIALRADAPTEAQAIEALQTMNVRHVDAVGGGTLYLENEVEFASYPHNNVNRSAAVTAMLPTSLEYQLYQRTVNGSVDSSGLSGGLARFDNTNGGVTLAGGFATAELSTVNGSVSSSLTGTGSSQARLIAVNGGVDATVATVAGAGYDLEALTGNGAATVVVAGTEPVGAQSGQHAHYRSPDYGSSNPRISVDARTGNGSATIHQ